jgi:hypothetical protein
MMTSRQPTKNNRKSIISARLIIIQQSLPNSAGNSPLQPARGAGLARPAHGW